MKRLVSMVVVGGLVLGLATPAFAQNSPEPVTPAAPAASTLRADQIGAGQTIPRGMSGGSPSGRALTWTGAGLFVAGMGVGIYGFLNNSNGQFPEFGEAAATNTRVGVAGLTAAFAGGALMFLGHRISRHAPDVQVSANRLSVSKSVSW